MNRLLCSLMTLSLAGLAHAAAPQPVLVGASYTVNNGPGSQTDPHVSGDLVAYSNDHSPTGTTPFSEIRFHALSTGIDQAIPNAGAYDYLSGIYGQRIVFTRIEAAERSIHLYDIATGKSTELAPKNGAFRDAASIGGSTIAWADYGLYTAATPPEIVVHDLQTKVTTALTANAIEDSQPAVSPNGDIVVFRRCAAAGDCDIVQATKSATGWTVAPLTSTLGDETAPATDGTIVAYESLRANGTVIERDIFFQSVGGGLETVIPLPGVQQNPSVAGGLIAFESALSTGFGGGNFDLLMYDSKSQILYQLTQTQENETLTDIDVDPATGLVRVVFVRNEAGDENVYAFSFRLETTEPCAPEPRNEAEFQAACAAPGTRPLLATVSLIRTGGAPDYANSMFGAAPGTGLLCLDNGQPTGAMAVSGRVAFNGITLVHPNGFKKLATSLAAPVSLSSTNLLHTSIAGAPGTSFGVRVYGASACTQGNAGLTNEAFGLHESGRGELRKLHGRPVGRDMDHTAAELLPSDARSQGCTSAGTSLFAGGLLMWMALLARRTRTVSQRVRTRQD